MADLASFIDIDTFNKSARDIYIIRYEVDGDHQTEQYFLTNKSAQKHMEFLKSQLERSDSLRWAGYDYQNHLTFLESDQDQVFSLVTRLIEY